MYIRYDASDCTGKLLNSALFNIHVCNVRIIIIIFFVCIARVQKSTLQKWIVNHVSSPKKTHHSGFRWGLDDFYVLSNERSVCPYGFLSTNSPSGGERLESKMYERDTYQKQRTVAGFEDKNQRNNSDYRVAAAKTFFETPWLRCESLFHTSERKNRRRKKINGY